MIALCVDDEYLLLRALTSAVRASPYVSEAVPFEDSEDALAWAKTHPFDVAFLDIRMPVMDGMSLARELRALHPRVPIFFCTGYREYAVDAFEVHASGYLVKPVTADAVSRELEYLTQGRTALLTVRRYGGFEAFDRDGKALRFRRSRARELLALLIDRNGMGMTAKAICAVLFDDDGAQDQKNMDHFYKLYYDLVRVLREAGAGEAVKKRGSSYLADMTLIRLDDTDKGARPYLEEFEWAEE